MESDMRAILRDLGAAAPVPSSTSYVQVAKRVHLGASAVEYSHAIAMEGFNAVFVECTVFAATGSADPFLKVYVQVSNDQQNWSTLPLGGVAVYVGASTVGYYKLAQGTIGELISAAFVRLRYETDPDTTSVVFSVGLDRKRIAL
jgi:hypothetical protein